MRRWAALALAAAACPVLAQWRLYSIGPAPIGNGHTGRVSAIACHPTDPQTAYIGGADGGVWKTSDGGDSWKPLTDRLPTTAIGAIALDPNLPETVFAGTGEANFAQHSRYGLGILKSLDGGASWELLAGSTFAGRCISKLWVDPRNGSVVWAAATPAGGFPEKAAAKLHPGRNGPIGIFRSADGGATWSQSLAGLPNQAATDLAVDPSNPDTMYAAIGRIFGAPENGIYKSVDGGTSWFKLGGGLPANPGRISLAVAPSSPNRLFALIAVPCDAAGGAGGTLGGYRSDDGGATWSTVPVGSIQATYGWYLSTVTVSPSNPDVVLMGGLSLRRSTSGGGAWTTVTPPHVDMHALAWDASGRLWCGDDGGVHLTSDLGSNWLAKNSGLGLIQFYAGLSFGSARAGTIWGGMQDNGTARRTPSRTWSHSIGGDGGWTQIDRTNPLRMFGESQGTGNLFRSTNGGASFSASNAGIVGADRNCFMPPYAIDPANPMRMLYGTHRVYESVNGGSNWTPVSGDVTLGSGAIRSLAIAPSDSQRVYLTTNDGLVRTSADGGRTFSTIRAGHPGWPRVMREFCIHPGDPGRILMPSSAFGTDQVLFSTDFGANWTSLDGNLPDVPVNAVLGFLPHRPQWLFAGADDGLYRSEDFGQTWVRMGLPRAPVIDLVYDPASGWLLIATQGRGAWLLPLDRR